MMKIDTSKSQIVEIANAFLVQKVEWLDDAERLVESAYQFAGDDEKRAAFVQLVYDLAEYYGFMQDKYGVHNLDVNFNKKGRGVE